MRIRLLAFILPATLISAALLIVATSLVSALESKFMPAVRSTIELVRFESRCDVLNRKIGAISRSATNCEEDLQCLGSPILCPIVMDERTEREYRALREELAEQCGMPTRVSKAGLDPTAMTSGACPSIRAGLETRSAVDTDWPATFVF